MLWRKIRLVETGNGGVGVQVKIGQERQNLKKVIIIYNNSYFYYLS